MPVTLLPASAAAFAPRGAPNVVLNSKVEPWLTATLKRINRIKRPLNSVPQHQRCLTETLSAPTAIWTLCSIMLPKAPTSELRRDDNPLVEALFNYQLLHIEAYVVHVDMVSQNEVAFKLTQDTIDSLIEYHKDIFSVDTSASTWNWSEKETQLKKLQEDFVQAINKFVFRTIATALEGLEEDGGGELLCGGSDEVKGQILNLFLPLLPPPPKAPEIIRPTPILPSSTGPETWWPSQYQNPDSWRMTPSSPSTTSSIDSNPNMWTSLSMEEYQLPSPAPSFSQPFSTGCFNTTEYYSSPIPMTTAMTCAPMTSAPIMPQLPLPSMIAQQCSTSAGFDGFMGGFSWDRFNEYAMPYVGTTM